MSEAPRSSRNVVLCLLLLCAGVAAWYFSQKPEQISKSVPAVQTAESSAAEKAAPPKRIQEEVTAHQVSSSLTSEARPKARSSEEELNERLDKALAGGQGMQGGDAVGGALAAEAPSVVEPREDSVVTHGFVTDLAFWLVANYTPSSHEGREGRTELTLRRTNARYSSSADLRSSERDALKARTAVLRHVFSPGMLEALYLMYGPRFLDDLEKASQLSRRTLNGKLTADMLKVYAAHLKRVSFALDAASKVNISALVRPMRRAAATEESASEDFAKAYTAHSEARDAGRTDIMAEQSDRMVQSARLASEFDARKERAGRAVARALQQKAQGPTLSESELVFLAEWLERRKASPEAAASASSICRRMADDMARRASELKVAKSASAQ